jgi:hypothetical protein
MTSRLAGPPGSLERLAEALTPGEFAAVLVTGTGRRPCLTVVRRATLVTETVYTDDCGWFWWSWAERIAETDDPLTAAYHVTAALRGTGPAGGRR